MNDICLCRGNKTQGQNPAYSPSFTEKPFSHADHLTAPWYHPPPVFDVSPSGFPPPIAPTTGPPAPDISVVIPGLNEAESLPELTNRLCNALEGKATFEIIFVDDGSTDNSWEVIRQMQAAHPQVSGVRLRSNFGKAMALSAGFERARGEIVVMMDADLQDDPADLGKFVEAIEAGADVVVGWKVNRLDPQNRLILSRIFNGTVRVVTGVKLHDMNCGFKAYRAEVLQSIPIYADLFRFIPVFAEWQGFKVAEVPITHHQRKYGKSRYGIERVLRGMFDLMTVTFISRYSRKPMHLFGLIGLLMGGLGFAICGYLTAIWFMGEPIGHRPLLILGTLLVIVGLQFFSLGLISEFLAFQYQRKHHQEVLPVREVVGPARRA